MKRKQEENGAYYWDYSDEKEVIVEVLEPVKAPKVKKKKKNKK